MKKIYSLFITLFFAIPMMAEGWPNSYSGVMLQGFYWNSFTDSKWVKLEKQADNFSGYFDLIWVPQSGKCQSSTSMGYDPYYFFNQNSSFGTVDELKSMISTFKSKGIGTLADVVINHHNTTGWFSFPAETYNGKTYQLLSTDIVANDDNGKTKTQATTDGVNLSNNNDEGEGWDGMRDLDHKSTNVQTVIKAYEKFLLELGYIGFRYDMVKGFNGSHVGDYNDAAGVTYSIGECWDSNSTIENWINATSKKSAAFDFQFRYNVRDAINNNDWSSLNSTNNLIHDANYRQYAITFVENHDTEKRSDADQDPILSDTLAANAYLLAMPGTPCVFYKHLQAYPTEIKAMIDARKAAGVTNTSSYINYRSQKAYYANNVTGSNGQLLVVVGSGMDEPSTSSWVKILSGHHYAYYLSPATEVPFADKPSGEYTEAFHVALTAVSATSGAKLVYTLDGTIPTASSKSVASGADLTISNSCTLKVGLLVNGKVTKTITRNYTIKAKEEEISTDIKIYVNADNAGSEWSSWAKGINYWTWNDSGNLYTTWPGKSMTTTATVNKKNWIVAQYTVTTSNPTVGVVFSMGTGSPQTEDKTDISKTSYLEISSEKDSQGHYTINDVTATGIEGVVTDDDNENGNWYTLQGVSISEPKLAGIYIHNGKKIIIQ
jgi:alpha-amylase